MSRPLKAWLVHRLCDLHTRLSLWQFDVEEWLERLDPTTPVPPRGARSIARAYWYDGQRVHEQELQCRIIYDEVRFRVRRARR